LATRSDSSIVSALAIVPNAAAPRIEAPAVCASMARRLVRMSRSFPFGRLIEVAPV
jgi:hypothetical protein